MKNTERLSHVLLVSIECWWRHNNVINIQQDENTAYKWVQIFYRKLKINVISIGKGK